MIITELLQVMKFFSRPMLNQNGHKSAAFLKRQSDCFQAVLSSHNASEDMSKNIVQLKSLHHHAIAVISTSVNGEFHYLMRFL
jgi:hypothetical protein